MAIFVHTIKTAEIHKTTKIIKKKYESLQIIALYVKIRSCFFIFLKNLILQLAAHVFYIVLYNMKMGILARTCCNQQTQQTTSCDWVYFNIVYILPQEDIQNED